MSESDGHLRRASGPDQLIPASHTASTGNLCRGVTFPSKMKSFSGPVNEHFW